MTEQPARQIAVVRSYDELMAALRKRATDLNVSRNVFDEISGLQVGYAAKLLAPVPIRSLGRTSMGLLLSAMGLMLIVVEDVEMLAKITKRHTPRRSEFARHADESMLTNKRKKRRGFRGSEAGKLLRARGVLMTSDRDRKRQAKVAAKARWGRWKKTNAEVRELLRRRAAENAQREAAKLLAQNPLQK